MEGIYFGDRNKMKLNVPFLTHALTGQIVTN